jgi:hypothetical protein
VKNAVFSESEDLASPEFDGLPSLNKSIEVKVVVYKKNPFAQTTVPTTPLTTVLSTVSTVQPTTLASTSTTTTICPGDECNPEPGVHYCCALGLKCYSGGCCAEAQYCNPVPGTEYCCLPGQECSSTGCCDAAQFCNPAPAIRECCGPAAPSCGPQGCV